MKIKKEIWKNLKISKSFKIDRFYGDLKGRRYKLTNDKISYFTIYENENYIKTLIYDLSHHHVDIIDGDEPCLKNNVYISRKRDLYLYNENAKQKNQKWKKVLTLQQSNRNLCEEKKKESEKFIFFDYETITDFNNKSILKPYSLSIFICDTKTMLELDEADNNNKINTVNEIIKKGCINFTGFDCSKKFYEYIKANQQNIKYTLVSFNGANFDNFILADYLYENEIDAISNVCYTNSSLLNFKINGRHSTFDLAKHLVGSLAKNCKSFKIKCCCKKHLDHNEIQVMYEANKEEFIEKMKMNKEMIEYNNFDVVSLAVLFSRYSRTFLNSKYTDKIDLKEKLTIGSIIWEVFEKFNEGKNLPKLDNEEYKAICKHKIAGRVELFNGTQKIKKRLSSYDVCSLYPFICSIYKCWFPCGEIKNSSWADFQKFRTNNKNHIGFFWVNVDQSNLIEKNLPTIYAHKKYDGRGNLLKNDWKNPKINNVFLSSVIIDSLLKYNCDVEFIEKKGIYFTQVVKNHELFGFLRDFMKGKNDQDKLKGTKEYNAALRETLKLLMNAISGKVIEGLHCDKIKLVNYYEYNKIKNDKKTTKINTIDRKGNKIFMSYTIDEETLLKKQRPVYLGALIYDYAKMYMYDNIYSQIGLKNLVYTDTDAAKCRNKHGERWIKKYANKKLMADLVWEDSNKYDIRYKSHKLYEKNSKVFGSFENELTDKNIKSYILMKKTYMIKNNNGTLDAFHFKGVSKNNIYLTGKEDFIITKTIKHKNGTKEKKFLIENQVKARDFYNKSKNVLVKFENGHMINVKGEQVFKDILSKKGFALVLSMNFKKSFKNNKLNVGLNDSDKFNKMSSNIKQIFQIKKLRLCS